MHREHGNNFLRAWRITACEFQGCSRLCRAGGGHATLGVDEVCNMLGTERQMAESTSQGARRRDLARAESQIGEHWVLYLILGLVLLIGGLAAVAFPFLSTIAAKLALGWIFL